MKRLFITGTDTGVGKTVFTSWLVRRWREAGRNAVGLKPICAGDREDGQILREAAGNVLTLDQVNPVYFEEPLAPWVAATREGREILLSEIVVQVNLISQSFDAVAVEGVGGWRVPLTKRESVREWAMQFGWPVLVVARRGLGTINSTLLTVESIQAAGLICAGVVLNDFPHEDSLASQTNPEVLRGLLGVPVLEWNSELLLPHWLQ